ncbi:hypothetical protein K4039_10995 [Lyngbya sp. CCAP 1446/10]|uniref:hypothetical protein n=1 Tax=Lyngbya sp. CCAP 1446/10 TaxID=439293 RepID=UPI00223809BD|nr:hypothetical protein [Lyngbya sp. CCAP 1446/10]MCW6050596.1 hypothetical protein [Lyngbya sp. CCAP 1446/10]
MQKEEGRRKKEEGRRKKEEGRRKKKEACRVCRLQNILGANRISGSDAPSAEI